MDRHESVASHMSHINLHLLVRCKVPKYADMEHPYAVEVHDYVTKGTLFEVCLEKGPTPLNLIKFHIPLRRWDVDQASLTKQMGHVSRKTESTEAGRLTLSFNTIFAIPSGYQNKELISSYPMIS